MTEALSVNEDTTDCALTQKELGAYYTPDNLTLILSKWAIRSCNDHIFEPSFGGCGFLQSAVNRLSELGSNAPHNQLCGCDIDRRAFNYLSEKLNVIENINERFLHKDYLETLPADFIVRNFDVVIGNPPYISLHNLSTTQKKSVEEWQRKQSFNISKRASLWAYFVIHSLSFLKESGRMAWVLPGSLLHADYGVQLQEFLLTKFGHVSALKLGERVFVSEGTEERTIVLLCDEYGQTSDKVEFGYVESLGELENALYADQATDNAILDNPDIYEIIANREDTCSFGELAKVLIGTVTGANNFFILKPSEARKLGLGGDCIRHMLSKFSYVKGMGVTPDDFSKWEADDYRCLVFHVDDESKVSEEAKAYAATFDEDKKSKNQTFKKRGKWLAADDKRIPHAFLSYMTHHGPKLVLNDAHINSTNSIHRVLFNEDVSNIKQKLIAISLCTSFSQLSAEIEGRSYGSGVLKLEPSEAKSIKLVLPPDKTEIEINEAFSSLDILWRRGDLLAVQKSADDFIFSKNDRELLSSVATRLENARKQRRRI